MMKNILIISCLALLFFGCNPTNKVDVNNSAISPFIVVVKKTTDFSENTLKQLSAHNVGILYADKNYSISSVDWGEWGGYVIFKDSVTKFKYIFPSNTVCQVGKYKDGYLVFDYSHHAGYGTLTFFKNPKNLYFIPDTTKIFSSDLKRQIASYYENSDKDIVNQLTEKKDTLFGIVGTFVRNEKLYIIQSNQFGVRGWKIEPITIVSEVDIISSKYNVIDTLLKTQIHPSGDFGSTIINESSQTIRFETPMNNKKDTVVQKGLIVVKNDSLIIIE